MDTLILFMLILIPALGLGLLMREGLVKKPWHAVVFAVLLALAFSLRAACFDMETGDYRDFLTRWLSFYQSSGGFRAFGEIPPWCNYHVPYLYFLALFSYLPYSGLHLIKILSVLFDLVLAWS